MKYILILLLFIQIFFVFSQEIKNDSTKNIMKDNQSGTGKENSNDIAKYKSLEKDVFQYDKLKRQNVLFNFGGKINTNNYFLIGDNGKYFDSNSSYPFVLSPLNKWHSINTGSFWGMVVFEKDSFIKINMETSFVIQYESIVPIFNISELYFSWKYPLGKLILGRTLYDINSTLSFFGTLDGIMVTLNVPFLNFKSFVGFSGFTGVFHPSYNNFNITDYDRSFVEVTNLTNFVMVVQINGNQSRRLFIATDFDFYYLFFHINPYLLIQYDVSNIQLPSFSNNDLTLNTFTVGILHKLKILPTLFLDVDINGVFGAMQDIKNNTLIPLSSFGLVSELRWTFTPKSKASLSLCYGLGFSNESSTSNNFYNFRRNSPSYNYIYYGHFNGGYVLEPKLTNIHSVSLKFNSAIGNFITFYIQGFQTFKLFENAPISDSKADINNFVVGAEGDVGIKIKFNPNVSLAIDSGVFFPMMAYSDLTPRLKFGVNLKFEL